MKTHDARTPSRRARRSSMPVAETTRSLHHKWLSKASGVEQEWRGSRRAGHRGRGRPGGLKTARTNATDKITGELLVDRLYDLRGTVPDLETTFRMYRKRAFDLVTISTNPHADAPAVLAFLRG